MKPLVVAFCSACAAIQSDCIAQSTAYFNELSNARNDAYANGWKILEDESYYVNNDMVLIADVHQFYAGTSYVLAFYVDECYGCAITFRAYNGPDYKTLYPDIQSAGGISRAMYSWTQDSNESGDLICFVNEAKSYNATIFLFSK